VPCNEGRGGRGVDGAAAPSVALAASVSWADSDAVESGPRHWIECAERGLVHCPKLGYQSAASTGSPSLVLVIRCP